MSKLHKVQAVYVHSAVREFAVDPVNPVAPLSLVFNIIDSHKQRGGPTGYVDLRFKPETTTFEEEG